MSSKDTYEPTYRQKNVDSTLAEHDTRISRLEKMALIGFGYGVAEGSQIITDVAQFL